MSSIRFKNSGLKECFNKSSIFSFVFSNSSLLTREFKVSFRIISEPKLLVIIIRVFLKSTVRPFESVKRPSSIIWSMILKTSLWAFSISSNNITEYGFLLTASVNWPPSSYPTYPGGAPIKRATWCFSIYSDISIRIIASSSLNMNFAKAFASCVLPTPVGPRKINVPIGRFGSFKPERARRIAFETASTASSWPITSLWSKSSIFRSFSISPSISLFTGMFVHLLTTLAMSSSSISSLSKVFSFFLSLPFSSAFLSRFSSSISLPNFNSAAFWRSVSRSAFSISIFVFSISSRIWLSDINASFSLSHWVFKTLIFWFNSFIMPSRFWIFLIFSSSESSFFMASRSISSCIFCRIKLSNSLGIESISIRKEEAASSIKSMALSGKNLSWI